MLPNVAKICSGVTNQYFNGTYQTSNGNVIL